jgi:hypothetical protein
MTPHQILIVALRIGAVLWFLHGLSHATNAAMYAIDPDTEAQFKAIVISLAVLELFASFVMWAFPATIARWLLPSGETGIIVTGPDLTEWQTLGVILIGLLVLADAIPEALWWVVNFAGFDWKWLGHVNPFLASAPNLVAAAVKLLIGFWLLFGANGLVAFLFRVRTAGLRS